MWPGSISLKMTMLHIFTPHRLWVKFVDLLTNYLRWPTILEGTIASVLGYVILVRLLRWCRYNAIHREYKKKYQDGTITPSDAQRIILVSTSYDMPLLFTYSLGFAQFKTFAIVVQLLLYPFARADVYLNSRPSQNCWQLPGNSRRKKWLVNDMRM